MNKNGETKVKILNYLEIKGRVSPIDLVNYLGISRQALFKHLGKLMETGVIRKMGSAPLVFYSLSENIGAHNVSILDKESRNIINSRYMIITPSGEIKNGLEGFTYWCLRNKLPIEKTAREYIKTLGKYDVWKKDNLIDATPKIKDSFQNVGLDKLFYIDFYSIERFGKTKLGQYLLYAKQSQDKSLMKQISDIAHEPILNLIEKYTVNGVGFIPPSVKREVQLMKELERLLDIPIKRVELVKVRAEVTIPQKTLSKLDDRVENAKNSIVINDSASYENILLIDDAVGSGATLNETALQLKKRKMVSGKVIGLAITGSFKGFDVISEV